MSDERELTPGYLEMVAVDLRQRMLSLQAEDGTTLRFTCTPQGVRLQLLLGGSFVPSPPGQGADPLPEQPVVESPAVEPTVTTVVDGPAGKQAKSPAEVLSGKLQTKPAEGRPDGRGNPTAWARFLAHREGIEGALLMSATFHNRTRAIALGLEAGDQITAQGYYHPTRDPQRLPTFSVFHLLSHPDKK